MRCVEITCTQFKWKKNTPCSCSWYTNHSSSSRLTNQRLPISTQTNPNVASTSHINVSASSEVPQHQTSCPSSQALQSQSEDLQSHVLTYKMEIFHFQLLETVFHHKLPRHNQEIYHKSLSHSLTIFHHTILGHNRKTF